VNFGGFDFSQLNIPDVTHSMQLALGPVFLLNGVGILLAMMTARLARIVDRARGLEARLPVAGEAEAAEIHRTLKMTSRRGRLVNRAITLATVAALLVATVVALLFATAFVTFPIGPVVALLFVICMVALVGSLWCFLLEVRIATVALRFGPRN
jgi:hypothetical protein